MRQFLALFEKIFNALTGTVLSEVSGNIWAKLNALGGFLLGLFLVAMLAPYVTGSFSLQIETSFIDFEVPEAGPLELVGAIIAAVIFSGYWLGCVKMLQQNWPGSLGSPKELPDAGGPGAIKESDLT